MAGAQQQKVPHSGKRPSLNYWKRFDCQRTMADKIDDGVLTGTKQLKLLTIIDTANYASTPSFSHQVSRHRLQDNIIFIKRPTEKPARSKLMQTSSSSIVALLTK